MNENLFRNAEKKYNTHYAMGEWDTGVLLSKNHLVVINPDDKTCLYDLADGFVHGIGTANSVSEFVLLESGELLKLDIGPACIDTFALCNDIRNMANECEIVYSTNGYIVYEDEKYLNLYDTTYYNLCDHLIYVWVDLFEQISIGHLTLNMCKKTPLPQLKKLIKLLRINGQAPSSVLQLEDMSLFKDGEELNNVFTTDDGGAMGIRYMMPAPFKSRVHLPSIKSVKYPIAHDLHRRSIVLLDTNSYYVGMDSRCVIGFDTQNLVFNAYTQGDEDMDTVLLCDDILLDTGCERLCASNKMIPSKFRDFCLQLIGQYDEFSNTNFTGDNRPIKINDDGSIDVDCSKLHVDETPMHLVPIEVSDTCLYFDFDNYTLYEDVGCFRLVNRTDDSSTWVLLREKDLVGLLALNGVTEPTARDLNLLLFLLNKTEVL